MTTPLTDEDLAAIEARCNAATPGPWVLDEHDQIVSGNAIVFDLGLDIGRRDDVTFVVGAREDVPRLLAEVRWLRKMNAWLSSFHASDYDD